MKSPSYIRRFDAVWAALVVSGIAILFLVSPRPRPEVTREFLLAVVELGGPFHTVRNVDSWEFEHLAAHPGAILTEEHNWWQSRPLYVGLGWLLAVPFKAAGMRSPEMFPPAVGDALQRDPPFPDEYNRYSPEYAGFVLLNWLLLVASVLLLKSLMRANSFLELRMLLPVGLLLVNIVTKPFFWTPHLQIFCVFMPVASIYLGRALLRRSAHLRVKHAALVGLACGIAGLAYGAFAVTVAVALLVILFGDGLKAFRATLGNRVRMSACLLAGFFTPPLAWMAFVTARTGGFYAPETDRYRQFVWMWDSASTSPVKFATDLVRNVANYVGKAEEALIVPALLLAVLVVLFYPLASRPEPSDTADTRRAVIFFVVPAVCFYSLMGFYDYRLAWTLAPAMFVVLGLEAARIEHSLSGNRRLLFQIGAKGWLVAYVLRFILTKSGPYV